MRDEIFGGTLFDRKLFKPSFVKHKQITPWGIIVGNQIISDYEHWEADTHNLPKDLLYSPIRICFTMTTGCNLRCKTCFNSSGVQGKNEMNTKR